VKPRAAAEALTIVYVHGIGNKPAPAILKRQCDQALFGMTWVTGRASPTGLTSATRNPSPAANQRGIDQGFRDARAGRDV
jgi:hypothetical protein